MLARCSLQSSPHPQGRPAGGRLRRPSSAGTTRRDTGGTRPHPPLGGLLAGVGDLPLAAHQDPFGLGGAAENDVLVAGL
jgi:hypothetical protein